ncbi:hypothetical protein [Pseudomonas aeruginosa]|uniref:hypothetical protein n=1 Tax=Pseudomonas aeruginosa TaxID=287 RepID=UPI001CA4045E|nr:hypothetical protein [Pseudomonas aeruginosa]
MSSTQHQLIKQCATRLRGIVEALDNIHDTSPQRWSTDLDDVHSSAESLLAMIKDHAPPSEDQLIATGLSYPLAKEDAVKLWYSGFRSEVITVLEAWEAIGHDIGMNPSKGELLDSLRNMAAICNAHGNDMPAQSAIDQRQVIADAITGALAFGAQAIQPPAADHWLRPFYDIGRAEGQRTQDLAMLVRMLASSLKRHAPESNLVARATNYLAAKGLAGTPLRDAPASVEQAGGDERVIGWRERILAAHPNSDPGFWPDALLVEHMAAEIADLRAALAQPSPAQPEGAPVIGCLCGMPMTEGHHSPDGCCNLEEFAPQAQAEQAEAERPPQPERYTADVFHPERPYYMAQTSVVRASDFDEFATQYERIVGALRFERQQMDRAFTACINERDAAQAEVARLIGVCASLDSEKREMEHKRDAIIAMHDAALARVAELGANLGAALGLLRESRGFVDRDNPLNESGQIKLLEEIDAFLNSPVAQAQQLHDLDKQCRDDVARALGLRPSQERGFAWSYLLASIKSCVKASEDAAQAQHSVPEGWMLVPVEPTQAQLSAGQTAWLADPMRRSTTLYRAMLAAAPQPVTEGE